MLLNNGFYQALVLQQSISIAFLGFILPVIYTLVFDDNSIIDGHSIGTVSKCRDSKVGPIGCTIEWRPYWFPNKEPQGFQIFICVNSETVVQVRREDN